MSKPEEPPSATPQPAAPGSKKRLQVCLVNMPLSAIHRPSLGLSALAAILKRNGISVRVLYPSLWFAEYFGYRFYAALLKTQPDDALVDWFFSGSTFDGHCGDLEVLLQRAFSRSSRLSPGDRQLLQQGLTEYRPKVPAFVDWAAREILQHSPDIVGCTSVFQQHMASLALLKRIHASDARIVTMMGGANCETIMGKTTHESFPWVDYVVSGEADELIAGLCRAILEHGRNVDPAMLPDGIFSPAHRTTGYPSSPGSYDGFPRATAASLEGLPPPDYDDYFHELDSNLLGPRIIPGVLFEASRGCWWGERKHCTFCGLNGEGIGYRLKPPEQVIDEIKHLSERYRSDRLEAVDNILALDYFRSLLPRLADMPDKLHIFFETKSNLKREQVRLLADAGVRWIQPGIESLHSSVLSLMQKGVSAWQNIQTLRYCRQQGIYVSWSILGYFPGEEDAWYDEMARIIPLLHHLQPGGFNSLRYDRYSPYHANPEEYGISLVPNASYQQAYPLPPEKIADIAYYFEEAGVGTYSPLLRASTIHGRPGLQAARDALHAWRSCWPGPELVAEAKHGALHIRDTRECATRELHVLTGLARQVLEACDDAPTAQRLHAMTPNRTEVDATVSELKANRLILEIDSRLLSLVLAAPLPNLPPAYQPFGRVLPAPGAGAPPMNAGKRAAGSR